MIEIREARPEEESEAKALSDRVFAGLRAFYRPTAAARQRKAALDAAGLRRFVAISASTIVGTVQCRREGGTVHLLALAVDPAWRRRGIASALIEQSARIPGGSQVLLFTIREAGNASFFEHLGFRAVEQFPDPDFESATGGEVTSIRFEAKSPLIFPPPPAPRSSPAP